MREFLHTVGVQMVHRRLRFGGGEVALYVADQLVERPIGRKRIEGIGLQYVCSALDVRNDFQKLIRRNMLGYSDGSGSLSHQCFTAVPQGAQYLYGCICIRVLNEGGQTIAFGRTVAIKFGLVEIDSKLIFKELRDRPIRKVEDVSKSLRKRHCVFDCSYLGSFEFNHLQNRHFLEHYI